MKNIYSLIMMLFFNSFLFSQPVDKKCNCCKEEYKQFDFWLGEWEVYNLKGFKVGENLIVSIQDHCLIQENWKSDSLTGTSYNFFDSKDKTWNQIYIDNLGTVLQLKGTFQNNKIILRSDKIKSSKANFFYYNQITWEKNNSGNVLQKWDIIDDSGKILQTAFEGIYKTKNLNNTEKQITIIDYVKVLNNKRDEAIYYYENNWKVFRQIAVKSGFIKSFELLQTKPDDNKEYDIILKTVFNNSSDYELSEKRFQQIIKETVSNSPNYLNKISPNEFRKIVNTEKIETNIK